MDPMHDGSPLPARPVIGVVVPFYQAGPGLLRRAVESALRQQVAAEVRVVVIDDGSPTPAAAELEGLAENCVRSILQPNAGPAAARNRGLAALAGEADIVAFLDSDDWWEPEHLALALEAFEAGAALYFANARREDEAPSDLDKAGWRPREEHETIDAEAGVFRYRGDIFDQIVRNNVIHTSAFAFRPAAFPSGASPGARFEETLSVGEDVLFFLDLARLEPMAAGFSSRVTCHVGSGVSIYARSLWGSRKWLDVKVRDMRFRRELLRRYPLSAEQRRVTREKIAATRRRLAAGFLPALRDREITPREAAGLLLSDPALAGLLPAAAMRALGRGAAARPAPP